MRMTFREVINEIGVVLKQERIRAVGGDIFIKSGKDAVLPWVAFAGNDFGIYADFGGYSRILDSVVSRAIKAVIPTFPVGKLPVPIFRLRPKDISGDDLGITHVRSTNPGYDVNEVSEFLEWMRSSGLPFLKNNATFELALSLAIKFNTYDQAQQYYLPALMLILRRQEEKDVHTSTVVKFLRETSIDIADIYERYLTNLDKSVETFNSEKGTAAMHKDRFQGGCFSD